MWPLNIRFLPPPDPIQRPTTLARPSSTSCHVTLRSELLSALLHVLSHLQFFARGARNVDHVAAHRDDLFFLDLGEDRWLPSRRAVVSVCRLSSAIFSVLGSVVSFHLPNIRHVSHNLPFCQTEIVWISTEFFVASFCDQEVVFEAQSASTGPVNAWLDRQHHFLPHGAGSRLVRIRQLVRARAHAVADRMRGLSGISAFSDARANQTIKIGKARSVAREGDTLR